MPIKTNLTTLQPARERYKTEVQLLSHGYYAPDQFPDGMITVFPWEHQIDEWIMRDGRKLQGRKLLWQLASRLCDLKGLPIEDMLVGDQSTVLLVARSLRYSSTIRYTPKCSICGKDNPMEEIVVPRDLARKGEKAADYPGFDDVILPDSKDVVRIRPIRVRDEMFIDDYLTKKTEPNQVLLSAKMLRSLLPIMSVGGGAPDNLDEAFRWFSALPPNDASYLDEQITAINPQLSTEIEHQCDHCEMRFLVPLPLDEPEFFRRSGSHESHGPVAQALPTGVDRPRVPNQPE